MSTYHLTSIFLAANERISLPVIHGAKIISKRGLKKGNVKILCVNLITYLFLKPKNITYMFLYLLNNLTCASAHLLERGTTIVGYLFLAELIALIKQRR